MIKWEFFDQMRILKKEWGLKKNANKKNGNFEKMGILKNMRILRIKMEIRNCEF